MVPGQPPPWENIFTLQHQFQKRRFLYLPSPALFCLPFLGYREQTGYFGELTFVACNTLPFWWIAQWIISTRMIYCKIKLPKAALFGLAAFSEDYEAAVLWYGSSGAWGLPFWSSPAFCYLQRPVWCLWEAHERNMKVMTTFWSLFVPNIRQYSSEPMPLLYRNIPYGCHNEYLSSDTNPWRIKINPVLKPSKPKAVAASCDSKFDRFNCTLYNEGLSLACP